MLLRLLLVTGFLLLFLPLSGFVSTGRDQSLPKANSNQIPIGTVDPLYSLTSWVPSKTWNGTTYFGNSNTSEILEVNMQGQVVWRYAFPHPNAPSVVITGLMVLPKSNDVLFTIIEPESYRGAYEVSPQGQLVWSYLNKTISHDSVRLPNGDTLITAAHSEDYGPWPYTYPEVFEVNQQGQVVWQWHASQDYQNSAKYANVRSTDFGYWTHVNEALRLPNGNTMISVRNFNLTIIVDPSGKLLSSFDDPCGKSCGPLGHILEPHSPVPLPNGNYLTNSPGPGRVYEFNPATMEAVWQWPPPGTPSTTPDLRGSQRLPNGNTLICDSGGQLLEVTPEGQTVWALRYANYKTGASPQGAPFFQAERISYMSPGFAVTSPANKATYTTNTVPLSLAAGIDLGNVTYSIRNNSNGTWTVRNATLLQNVYKDSLDPPKTTNGPSSLNLANGNYTVRIFASSTGYGYKAFIQQKRINYATTDTTFIVAVPAATSTTTSRSSTLGSISTTTTVPTSTTSRSSSTTTTSSTSTTSTTTTTPTSTTTASTSTFSSQTTASSSTQGGGGGIPEFPFQILAVASFAFLLVASYLQARQRRIPGV